MSDIPSDTRLHAFRSAVEAGELVTALKETLGQVLISDDAFMSNVLRRTRSEPPASYLAWEASMRAKNPDVDILRLLIVRILKSLLCLQDSLHGSPLGLLWFGEAGSTPPPLMPVVSRLLPFATGPHWVGDICRATAHEALWSLAEYAIDDPAFVVRTMAGLSPEEARLYPAFVPREPNYDAVFRSIGEVHYFLADRFDSIDARTVQALIQYARIEYARAWPDAHAPDAVETAHAPDALLGVSARFGFRELIGLVLRSGEGLPFEEVREVRYSGKDPSDGENALRQMIARANDFLKGRARMQVIDKVITIQLLPNLRESK